MCYERAGTSTGRRPGISRTSFTGLMYFSVRPVAWDGDWLFSFSPSYHGLCDNLWHWRGIFCRLKCTQNVHKPSLFSFLSSHITIFIIALLIWTRLWPRAQLQGSLWFPLTPQHVLGASGFRSLSQGKYGPRVMHGGAHLKYRCAMVCGLCERVTNSSNIGCMKHTDMGIRSERGKKCGIW